MKKRLYLGILLIAGLSVFLVNPSFANELSHLLDGKVFVGNNGEKGGELDPDEHEEIIFQNGRFKSVSCDPYNFDSSEYTATRVGNAIHFNAVTESPSHGKIAWQGVVEGDLADVTFVWTKERWYWDIRREYWFQGKLKK